VNRESLSQLKAAKQTESVPAYLQIQGQNKGFYAFNYNPESFTDTLSASYAAVSASTSSVPYQDYLNGSGIKRSFTGLLLDTYSDGLSLRVIIDGIKDLMVAHPEKAEYEPPTVEFHWGSESFKPCKLLDMSYTIDLWLGGEPAKGTIDLTLVQIPSTDPARLSPTSVDAAQQELTRAIVSNPNVISSLPVSLTERQKADGVALAVADLKANLAKLSTTSRNAIRTGKFSVIINAIGEAKLLDPKGGILMNAGKYDGLRYLSAIRGSVTT